MLEIPLIVIALCLVALGAVAGFLAGLLGIGGGAVLVPGIYYTLSYYGYESIAMHTAVGTSLLTILFTGTSSAFSHYRHNMVDLHLVKQFIPGIVIGVGLGTLLASKLSTDSLKGSFAVLQISFGLYMLIKGQKLALFSRLPAQPWFSLIATLNAGIATLMGVGGGVQNVIYLTIFNTSLGKAIGTSAALGPVIAIMASIGFIIIGYETDNRPPYSLGFIHLPTFFAIIIASVAMAPVGAKLTHRLPTSKLKRIFTLFLFSISLKMIFEIV